MNEHKTALSQEVRGVAFMRSKAMQEVDELTDELQARVRDAHEAGVPKVDIARAAGVSRPTVDRWLEEK